MVAVVLVLLAGNAAMMFGGPSEAAADPSAHSTPAAEDGAPQEAEQPVTLSGSGDATEEFDLFPDPAVATVTHEGGGDFGLWVFNPGEDTGEQVLLNEGPYDGSLVVNRDGAGVDKVQITADGAWSVELQPLEQAPEWDGGAVSGESGAVLRPARTPDAPFDLDVAHDGEYEHFAVAAYTDGLADLLVNDSGPVAQTITVESAPDYIEITASRPWTLSPAG